MNALNVLGILLQASSLIGIEERAMANGIHWTEQYIADAYENAGYTVIYPVQLKDGTIQY